MAKGGCPISRRKELVINTTDIDFEDIDVPWQEAGRVQTKEDSRFLPVDLLKTLFAAQRELTITYLPIEERNGCVVAPVEAWGDLDDRQVQMRLKDLAQRTIEEICEATNCLKNKPWKNTFTATDRAHYVEEIADALHFFIEWVEAAGVGPDELFKLFFKKHAVNQFRQESNY